jgi:hypothetical protein
LARKSDYQQQNFTRKILPPLSRDTDENVIVSSANNKLLEIYVLLFFLIIGFVATEQVWGAKIEVIARGEGFQITQNDILALQRYFETRNMFTTEAEYRKFALKLKLFSMEAKALKLDKSDAAGSDKADSIEQQERLYNLYVAKLQRDYPLADSVIESYYRANPEKFKNHPLDETLGEQIRRVIVKAKRPQLETKRLNLLRFKYHVQEYNPQTGKFE